MRLSERLRGRSIGRLSKSNWSLIHRALIVRKRAALNLMIMDQPQRVQPLPRLAEIYRAMNGDKEAQRTVRICDVAGLENARNFEEFLQVNGVPVYEEVLQ